MTRYAKIVQSARTVLNSMLDQSRDLIVSQKRRDSVTTRLESVKQVRVQNIQKMHKPHDVPSDEEDEWRKEMLDNLSQSLKTTQRQKKPQTVMPEKPKIPTRGAYRKMPASEKEKVEQKNDFQKL